MDNGTKISYAINQIIVPKSSFIDLINLAKSIGVSAIEIRNDIPVNLIEENSSVTDDIDQRELLGNSLKEIVKVLSDFDLLGYIEPLGFETSSVRKKSVVVDEIKKLKTSKLKIVHDTFHHFLAGEKDFFPSMTGLVHISGVSNEFSNIELNDDHRYLINETDILGNINQIKYFLQSDYKGFFSFEPFAKDLTKNDNLSNAIERNINYIEEQL